MKFSSVLLIFASTLIVGCAGSNPVSPDVASSSATSGSTTQAFFPPIDPVGLSCPSDAPQIRVGSVGVRLDVEFSEVKGATAYEIEIVDYYGAKVRMEVPAPAHRAEWHGPIGLYAVRVRTINCGGFGNWSVQVVHALDDSKPGVPPPPVPQCMSGCEPPPPPPCVGECVPPPPQCMSECVPPPPPQCMHSCEPPQPPPCNECD